MLINYTDSENIICKGTILKSGKHEIAQRPAPGFIVANRYD